MGLIALIVILGYILIVFWTTQIVQDKGRSALGGFLLGLFFGPVGLMIALLMTEAPML